MLSLSLSLIPFVGSDIGGFVWFFEQPPTLELWVRWAQLGAVSGNMHDDTGGSGATPKTHIFDFPDGSRMWRKVAKLRMALVPYLRNEATRVAVGEPLMRHHIIDFPSDRLALLAEGQFLLGRDILAAPVTCSGCASRDVYLPAGEVMAR